MPFPTPLPLGCFAHRNSGVAVSRIGPDNRAKRMSRLRFMALPHSESRAALQEIHVCTETNLSADAQNDCGLLQGMARREKPSYRVVWFVANWPRKDKI